MQDTQMSYVTVSSQLNTSANNYSNYSTRSKVASFEWLLVTINRHHIVYWWLPEYFGHIVIVIHKTCDQLHM